MFSIYETSEISTVNSQRRVTSNVVLNLASKFIPKVLMNRLQIYIFCIQNIYKQIKKKKIFIPSANKCLVRLFGLSRESPCYLDYFFILNSSKSILINMNCGFYNNIYLKVISEPICCSASKQDGNWQTTRTRYFRNSHFEPSSSRTSFF